LGKVLGVDLAGSSKRPTGLCLLSLDLTCFTYVVYEDEEITEAALKYSPEIIAIDSPLTMPRGRRNLEDREGPHFRKCDLELIRRGIRLLPPTLGPMRLLTKRGIALRMKLEEMGFRVIEAFPGATRNALGIPSKKHGLENVINALRRLGVKISGEEITDDETDAIVCALTGLFFIRGEYEAVGESSEGVIIIPRPATSIA